MCNGVQKNIMGATSLFKKYGSDQNSRIRKKYDVTKYRMCQFTERNILAKVKHFIGIGSKIKWDIFIYGVQVIFEKR